MMPPVSLERALVIAGKMGSGKSTAVRAIAEKLGLKIVSFGDLIRAKALERGVQQARETLQQIGHEMLVTGGPRCLLRAALENAGVESGESVVFDGVRDRLVLDEIKAVTNTIVTFYLDVGKSRRCPHVSTQWGSRYNTPKQPRNRKTRHAARSKGQGATSWVGSH